MKGYLVTVVESNSRSIFVSGESAQSDEQASELVKQYYENNRIAVGSKYLEDFDVSSVDIDSEHLKYMGDNISTLEEALAEVPNSAVHQNVQPDRMAPSEPELPPSSATPQQSEVASFGAFSSNPQPSQFNSVSGGDSQVCPTKVGDIIELNGKRFEAIYCDVIGDFEMMSLDSFGEARVVDTEDGMNMFYENGYCSVTTSWFNSLTPEQKSVMKECYSDNDSLSTKTSHKLYAPDMHRSGMPSRDRDYLAVYEHTCAFYRINSTGEVGPERPSTLLTIYPMFVWSSGKTCNGRKVDPADTDLTEEDSQDYYDSTDSSEEDTQVCPTEVGDIIELNGKRFEAIVGNAITGFKMMALDSFGEASATNMEECVNLFYENGVNSKTAEWYNSLTPEQKGFMYEGYPDNFSMVTDNRHRLYAPNAEFMDMPSRDKTYLAIKERERAFYGIDSDGRAGLKNPDNPLAIYPVFTLFPDKSCNGRKVTSANTESAGEDSQVCPTKIGDIIELHGMRFEAIADTPDGDFEMMALDSFGEANATNMEECRKFFHENGNWSYTTNWFHSLTSKQKSVMKEDCPDILSMITENSYKLNAPIIQFDHMPSRAKSYFAINDLENSFLGIGLDGEVCLENPKGISLAIYPIFTWLSGKTCTGRKVNSTNTDLEEDNSQISHNNNSASELTHPTKVGDIIELNGKRFEAVDRTSNGGFEMMALDSFGEMSTADTEECMKLFYENSLSSKTAVWFSSLTPEQKDVMKECYPDTISRYTNTLRRLHAPDVKSSGMPSRDKDYSALSQVDNAFFRVYSSGRIGFQPAANPLAIYPMFTWISGKTLDNREVTSTDTESSEEDSQISYDSTNSAGEDSQVCPTKVGDIIELNGKRFEAIVCDGFGDFEMMALDSFGEASITNTEDGVNLFYENCESSRTAEWFNSLTPEQKSIMLEFYTDKISMRTKNLHKLHAPNMKSSGMPSRDKNYSALSQFDEAFFRIYSSGVVGLKITNTPLAIYPLFTWLSGKTCNGRKITSTDTNSAGESDYSQTVSSESSEEDSQVSYNNTNSSVSEDTQVCPTKVGDIIELNGKRFEAVKCTFDGNFSMMSLDSFGEARAAGIENCMNLFYEDSENSRTAEWFNTLTSEQKNVMKEDYPDNLSLGLDNLRRLNAPNVLFMQPPSRDKNYFAISDFATEVVEIYSTGEVGIKDPTEQLAIYPTFIWLSGKTCNGRKVTPTNSKKDSQSSQSNSVGDHSQVCPTKVGDIIELNGKRFEAIDIISKGEFEMMALDSFGETSVFNVTDCVGIFCENDEISRTAEWFNALTSDQKGVMKECYHDRVSQYAGRLHKLHAPDISYKEMPSRDTAFFAINNYEGTFFEVHSTGEAGLRKPQGRLLNIYPMFTWLPGKTCTGRKINSTNIEEDQIVSSNDTSEPSSNIIKADDLLFK